MVKKLLFVAGLQEVAFEPADAIVFELKTVWCSILLSLSDGQEVKKREACIICFRVAELHCSSDMISHGIIKSQPAAKSRRLIRRRPRERMLQ